MKTFRIISSLLLLAPIFMLSACHNDEVVVEHTPPGDPDSYYVSYVPAGGQSFGTFNQFEHDFSTRDISSFDDIDGFTFSLAQESTVMLTVTAQGGLNAWLDLYDGNFNFLQGDDNGGPGLDPVIVTQLPAGSYLLVVGGVLDSQGTFDIDIVTGSLGGLDFGVLTPSTLYYDNGGYIDNASDFDTYFFTLKSAAVVDLALFRLSGNFDGNLQLVDQFGNEVIFVDPFGDADPTANSLSLPAGTYMLTGGAGFGSGACEIQVNVH